MDEPLDEQYLKWLYHQVASVRLKNPARTYWFLIKQLFRKEYVWLVPNDDNRVEDGRDLRSEFLEECALDLDPEWMEIGCSMLEMLIGLSRRLAFEAEEGDSRDWFWKMLENIDLRKYNDFEISRNHSKDTIIDEVLDQVIWRTYDESGRGGLFPLRSPPEDQRKVELWYQMGHYLLERV